MAKMRVHEFAKELEIKSQEVIECLSGTEYEVKSANSNIEDVAQELVRKKYKKTAEVKAEAKPAEPKQESAPEVKTEDPKQESAPKAAEAPKTEAKPASESAERPKKKSSITAVFNAQYSKQGTSHGGKRPTGPQQRNQRPNDGRRPQNDRPAGQPKPTMSGNDMRKYFDSLINPNAAKEAERTKSRRSKDRGNRKYTRSTGARFQKTDRECL